MPHIAFGDLHSVYFADLKTKKQKQKFIATVRESIGMGMQSDDLNIPYLVGHRDENSLTALRVSVDSSKRTRRSQAMDKRIEAILKTICKTFGLEETHYHRIPGFYGTRYQINKNPHVTAIPITDAEGYTDPNTNQIPLQGVEVYNNKTGELAAFADNFRTSEIKGPYMSIDLPFTKDDEWKDELIRKVFNAYERK